MASIKKRSPYLRFILISLMTLALYFAALFIVGGTIADILREDEESLFTLIGWALVAVSFAAAAATLLPDSIPLQAVAIGVGMCVVVGIGMATLYPESALSLPPHEFLWFSFQASHVYLLVAAGMTASVLIDLTGLAMTD